MRIIEFLGAVADFLARYRICGERYCVVCDRAIGRFLPYRGGWRAAPSLMRTLEIVGSDLDRFGCPRCGAHDRERHLLLYMRASGLMDRVRSMDILHFAPEAHLSRLIAQAAPKSYRKADLYPAAADIEKIDLLAIPCVDKSFDLILANHVLEHVPDDLAALREIRRVLRPGGYAILQTPFSAKLFRTWADPGIDTDAARLQAYGQEDHVRLFGRDIFDRIVSKGFVACGGSHEALLPQWNAEKYGLNPREPFLLFRRPEDD